MDHQPQIFEDVIDIHNVGLGWKISIRFYYLQLDFFFVFIHRFDIYKVKLMDTMQIQTWNENHNINTFFSSGLRKVLEPEYIYVSVRSVLFQNGVSRWMPHLLNIPKGMNNLTWT